VVAGHRVIPNTDALTAATWTALGAAGGVALLGVGQGVLHVPSARCSRRSPSPPSIRKSRRHPEAG
jgi:hypothetical protein